LSSSVAGDSPIVVKVDSLHLLVGSIANRDVEVTDLPIVEDEAFRWVVESFLIVEDALLQAMEPIFIRLSSNGSVSFTVGDSLEESICDGLEECGIQVRLGLESGLDGGG
jgi:hypothetical protein